MKNYLNAVEDKSRGLWTLTSDGLKLDISNPQKIIEIVSENKRKTATTSKTDNKKINKNEEIIEEVSGEEWKDDLLNVINNSSPESFERLSKRILRESGCVDVNVVGGANDKGIDGTALLKWGLISFSVKFQCKRYGSSNITPRHVREFRGALGHLDKGIFLTTSRFSKEASNEGVDPSKGKTIDLIDGDSLCELLRQYSLGVKEDANNEVKIDKEFFQNI